MASRDRERAAKAYTHVSAYLDEQGSPKKGAKKYATIVHKLPSLLQSAGLCQALHFASTRDAEMQKIVGHLATQLNRVNPKIKTADDLLARAREADLTEYLQLTQEAVACAGWYRRMVQGVLKVEAGDEEEGA